MGYRWPITIQLMYIKAKILELIVGRVSSNYYSIGSMSFILLLLTTHLQKLVVRQREPYGNCTDDDSDRNLFSQLYPVQYSAQVIVISIGFYYRLEQCVETKIVCS